MESIREEKGIQMSFLFDASSIFEALLRGNVKILNKNYTVEIARHELGNTL